jgi:hypothetical protein
MQVNSRIENMFEKEKKSCTFSIAILAIINGEL